MTTDSIAIVGIGAVFPRSLDLADFWRNIADGVDTSREVSNDRWLLPLEDVYDPAVPATDKVYSKRQCVIDGFVFDPSGLNLDPGLVRKLDPMFHLGLHAARQAWRSANTERIDRSRAGLIIGNIALPTEKSSALAREVLGRTLEKKLFKKLGHAPPPNDSSTHPLNRYVAGLPGGLIATALGLGRGAYTLDAACASSLYALKLACDELIAGRADAMLAGGLSRPDCLYTQTGFSQLRALSPTGKCSPFDTKGNGLLVGEGAGIVALKRLEDALRDEDNIYAVVRGIGLSNDVGGSLLAPDSEGQLRSMRPPYSQAQWSPREVDLIECHATGTPVGDAVEFHSLVELWGGSGWDRGQCVIGGVKSNIGHALTAAGAAGLIKVLLALQHQTLPPTANFEAPAEKIDLENSPFQVLTEARPWTRRATGCPRRAAVNAFGFGGINAHVLIEEWLPASRAVSVSVPAALPGNAPIAVVGLGAHFGPWDSLGKFQRRALGGDDERAPSPLENWWGAERSEWFQADDQSECRILGHAVDRVRIPLNQFRIPPKELEEILPQQLLMLQAAWQAIEEANLPEEDRLRMGVFIGIGLDLNTTNFSFRWSLLKKAREWSDRLGLNLAEEQLEEWVESLRDAAGPPLTANRTMGALGGIVASRVAREFRVGGPSFTLSSEESSGLHALEAARRALQRKEIDSALVGAVDLASDVRSVWGMLGCPWGSPFQDEELVVGDGAAAVILKRLEDAERDGDTIYAIVRGVGLASGSDFHEKGRWKDTYSAAIERSFEDAGIEPGEVSYVEVSGCGSEEQNALELEALNNSYGRKDRAPCALGSSRLEIGHTGAASALAAILKAALCLRHEILPPCADRELAVDSSGEQSGPFFLPEGPQFWLRDRQKGPRCAGVSSFSVDGNCGHVILEGYDRVVSENEKPGPIAGPLGPPEQGVFLLESETRAGLVAALEELHSMATDSESSVSEIAQHWLVRRGSSASGNPRVSMAVDTREELHGALELLLDRLRSDRAGELRQSLPAHLQDKVFFSESPLGENGRIAFVYPGSGNHFPGMGRELSAQWPEVLHRQDAETGTLRSQVQPDLFWNQGTLEAMNRNAKAAIMGQVTLGTIMTDMVRSFGLEPNAIIGYSLGESAGLFSMRVWRDRDEMLRRIQASTLFTLDLAGPCQAVREAWNLSGHEEVDWALGVVNCPAEAIRTVIPKHERVYLLIVNTPSECVIGGDRRQVNALVQQLDCRFFPVEGVTTVHAEVARPVEHPYRELHLFPVFPPEGVEFYSGVLGRPYEVTTDSAADSITGQAIHGFDFTRVIESAYANGLRIFLEMGPGASCSRMIARILGDRPHLARSACHPKIEPVAGVCRLMAQLAAEGVPVDLGRLYPPEGPVEVYDPSVPCVEVPVGGQPFEVPEPPSSTAEAKLAGPQSKPAMVLAPRIESDLPRPKIPAAVVASPVPASPAPVLNQAATEGARTEAHEVFLRISEKSSAALTQSAAFQVGLLEVRPETGDRRPETGPSDRSNSSDQATAPPSSQFPVPEFPPTSLDRAHCLEFAIGSISRVLGRAYEEVDSFPTRVRLPDEPLMLVDRILDITGKPQSMTGGRVVTEHDVLGGAWYLDGNRIPTCIAVEAGQADLFLSGFLGIDSRTRGLAVYRLLDAQVTFHRGLPAPGQTIRYDIEIERFFQHGQTWFFHFSFEGTVDGQPLISMKSGCAGFFSKAELAAGAGIVQTELDRRPLPGKVPEDWKSPAPMRVESYREEQVNALRDGDLSGCFGELFEGLDLKKPLRIPGGLMKLVDRVALLDPTGGRFGIGFIRAELDIHPDDWFLTCHFVDDMVMPGTLMYECCMHTLRIFLLRMGWVAEQDEVVCEPVPGVASTLKCRGQVIPSTRKAIYEITLKEIGYRAEPYVICDALMFSDDKPVVEITNMSCRLTGTDQETIDALWENQQQPRYERKPALVANERILAFAIGKPSEAFGERYKVFDSERIIARLPGPPYQFLDRITEIQGEPWELMAGPEIEAQYDVPPEAWYFESNSNQGMPFSVLLEVALQPCGWLAAYLGSALTSETDLSFRNLGGSAIQQGPVAPNIGTLSTRVKITNVSRSGGMIIQNYDFEVQNRGHTVYKGDTYFGFFSNQALANQVGIRDADIFRPPEREAATAGSFPYPEEAPYPDDQLRMIDSVDIFLPDGGPAGLGYIEGSMKVDPDAWFFKAHFYQDPVIPGSLGLESFLQLLKVVAVHRWGWQDDSQMETIVLGERHEWVYRGQVIPTDNKVTVQAWITFVDDDRQYLKTDGFLTVDGRVIYHMKDFSLRLR